MWRGMWGRTSFRGRALFPDSIGYELYITRASSWLDTPKNPLFPSEGDAVVAADAELKWSMADYYERQKPDHPVERFHPVNWTTHPDQVPFWFIDGAVSTKNPDPRTIRKMVELARKLNARVLGEGNEE